MEGGAFEIRPEAPLAPPHLSSSTADAIRPPLVGGEMLPNHIWRMHVCVSGLSMESCLRQSLPEDRELFIADFDSASDPAT